MDIYNLFPTAVGKSVRHLTDSEKKFFEELKYTDRVKNTGNSFTKNIHVLDNPILKDLKNQWGTCSIQSTNSNQ